MEMKAKVLDYKIVVPGDELTVELGVKPSSGYYVIMKLYALPCPPVGASLDELDELSSKVAKWLSSENLNI